MATTFDLTKANVKKISCIADGVSYNLKKVVDTSGNVLWQAIQSIPLSLTWTGTERVESDSPPDMEATLHGLDVLTYGPAIDHSFYAKVNESDSYALVDSRTNGGNTVFNFGVPDENRYYKLDITVRTSTSEEEYETTSISDELFIDYIKAEAPNVYVSIDNFFTNEEVYISDIISFPNPDIVVTACSSNITVSYDESNYYGHYRFTLNSAGSAWFKCYYPGDASRGIYDSDVVTCYFTVKQACTVTWASSNTYYLGVNARFTITNIPSGTAKVAIENATSIGSTMYNVGPVTLVSSSSTSYVYDISLSVLNSGSHVVDSEAIVGCLVRFDIYFYNSSGELITTSRATTPCAVNGMLRFPDTSDLYYTRSQQTLFGDYSACTITGTKYATNAGTYSITATINDTSLNMWEDGTRTPKTFTRRILNASWSTTAGSDCMERLSNGNVAIRIWDDPNGSAGTDSGSFTVTWAIYDSSGTTLKGSGTASVTPTSNGNLVFDTGVSANNLGVVKYRVSIAGKTNYNALSNAWSGTMDFSYISIDVPSAKTRTYDGTAQYGCDSGTGYTRSGTGTNAGSHTTTVSLKDGYIWSDGTTSDKKISWTMKKASFTGVQLRLGTSSPYYVQWRVLGPDCASGKSFSVDWSISNTNSSASQPRASGSDSYTASSAGNLVESNTGTYTSKNPSTYKYYGTWKFAGSTNFNAFTFTCSKSNAKKIERGTYVTVAS